MRAFVWYEIVSVELITTGVIAILVQSFMFSIVEHIHGGDASVSNVSFYIIAVIHMLTYFIV